VEFAEAPTPAHALHRSLLDERSAEFIPQFRSKRTLLRNEFRAPVAASEFCFLSAGGGVGSLLLREGFDSPLTQTGYFRRMPNFAKSISFQM
jgi:hypothetical protein